jgi:cobalt-precorrin-5B (C1)-methyltransferase
MRSGYTLPVFATASAIAALHCLKQIDGDPKTVTVAAISPPQLIEIDIDRATMVRSGMAIGMTVSDPGDNLDLTRDTPVWALVEWADAKQAESIEILGGEGVGKQAQDGDRAAIYSYARQILLANLARLLSPSEKIVVTIVLPEGRALATRTSNAAFGVVEGLSLLGTTGISQPLSAPGQLDACLNDLRAKSTPGETMPIVFCIGENGIDLAQQMGIDRQRIVKTANWIGPLLAEAGVLGVPKLLLFGYHGKLIKLAGGIFHTHHYLADGRLEILIAAAARMGLSGEILAGLFTCETAEDVLKYLRSIDNHMGSNWAQQIYTYLTEQIADRSRAYIYSQTQVDTSVGALVFDRQRQVVATSELGGTFLTQLC